MEKKLKSLWEKLKGGGQGNGPATTIHPTLNGWSANLGKQGIGTEPLEELKKASDEKHLFSIVAENENEAVTQSPGVKELESQHLDDLRNEPKVTKAQTEKVGKQKVDDLQLAQKKSDCQIKAKKRDHDEAKPKADEAHIIYVQTCDEEGLKPTGKKLAIVSVLLFYAGAVAIFGVEAAANFQAFLKVFRDDMISTAVVAFGTSLGITIMGKFCGAALASFKNQKARKLIPISIFVVALISAIVFSLLVGGTRAFGDPSHPLASRWSELGALAVNVFLFLCMIASTWSFQTKKVLAETINALLEEKLKREKIVEVLQKEIDDLEVAAIDKEIEIEADFRIKEEKAENHVRNQGIEVAKRVGKYHAILASINRQALIVSAGCMEAIWGIRIHNLLARKSGDPISTYPNQKDVSLDPKVYQIPPSEFPLKPEGEITDKNSSPNTNTHETVL